MRQLRYLFPLHWSKDTLPHMPFFQEKVRSLLSDGKRDKKKEAPWIPIEGPSNEETLLGMLLDMYWDGVYRELKHILFSLVDLQKVPLSPIEQDRQEQGAVAGYETFIDQICEEPRSSHAVIREAFSESQTPEFIQGGPHQPVHPLRTKAPANSEMLQEGVANTLKDQETEKGTEDAIHFRTRAMLQAAGFLDIDKLVEYKTPEERFNVDRKGKFPQLKVDHFQANGTPNFSPVRCWFCRDIIRGVLFKCNEEKCTKSPNLGPGSPTLGPDDYLCEYCYHHDKHPKNHLVKRYKRCILDEAITVDISRKLCKCTTLPRIDKNGELAALYPIDPELKHRLAANGMYKCRLFVLPWLVAEEKCRELQVSMESRKDQREGPLQVIRRSKRTVREPVYAPDGRLEEDLDATVPWVLQSFANKFPFGNTHISLMVGPLVIENGVFPKDMYRGVLITKRDPLNYFAKTDTDKGLFRSISVGYGDKKNFHSDTRRIFTQEPSRRKKLRLKACMKQVVGGAFSGYFERLMENAIVEQAMSLTRFRPKDKAYTLDKVHAGAEALMEKMKALLESRITTILARIASRLFDPSIAIEWDFFRNNCQYFIDSILRYEDFGGLFGNAYYGNGLPLYLMSFVVRIQSYDKAPVIEKHDVPNGQTEEYLLAFRSGRHDDADIVDTLHEYWHDWGAFGGPLYKHQGHFPWDCTEAYKESAPTCNNCTLSRHVWAFPFDSWSIIQLALQKDRLWYPSAGAQPAALSRAEWLDNRFRLFIAQDALVRGAIAMARTPALREAADWFRTSSQPRFDRLKLGGIHRAQPYSHHFEAGRFQLSYIAPWAHFTHAHRVRRYEAMRLARQQLREVPRQEQESQEAITGGRLRSTVEDLSVGIAGVAIFAQAAHMPNTVVPPDLNGVPDVLAAGQASADMAQAAVDAAQAAADLADAMQSLGEGIAAVTDVFGQIS